MGDQEDTLQDTLIEEDVEEVWDKLEKAISNYSERGSEEDLRDSLYRLEKLLKDGVGKRCNDSEEREMKRFQIELMIDELLGRLDSSSGEGEESRKKSGDECGEEGGQFRIEDY